MQARDDSVDDGNNILNYKLPSQIIVHKWEMFYVVATDYKHKETNHQ